MRKIKIVNKTVVYIVGVIMSVLFLNCNVNCTDYMHKNNNVVKPISYSLL